MTMTINTNKMVAMVPQHYELQIMVLGTSRSFHNKLEDVTYDGKPGEIVLKGTMQEEWIIPLKKVAKYMTMEGGDIDIEALPRDTWVPIQTRESTDVTWMVQIPEEERGEVTTERGDILKVNRPGVEHGGGDWVCCCDNDGAPTLEWGCWVVNGEVVKRTYQPR